MKTDHAVPRDKAAVVGRVVGRSMAVGAAMLARELDQPLSAGELELEGFVTDLTAQRPQTRVHVSPFVRIRTIECNPSVLQTCYATLKSL